MQAAGTSRDSGATENASGASWGESFSEEGLIWQPRIPLVSLWGYHGRALYYCIDLVYSIE